MSMPPGPQQGPCAGCGSTGYPLSMGGPGICPACDCIPPERRVRQLADENRRLYALLAEHGIDPRPMSMLQPFSVALDDDESQLKRVPVRPVTEAEDRW